MAGFTLSAQEKDSIGTETVTVTTAYKAQVNDAFKIQDRPDLNDADNQPKIDIDYQINSVPVASTFKPEKGQAAKVDEDSLKTIYNNHVWMRAGNYSTFEGELSITEQVNENLYLGGNLSHLSTFGDIEEVKEYDTEMSRTRLNFYLGNQGKNNEWKAGFGAFQNSQHWYGIPAFLPLVDTATDFTAFDTQQLYSGVYANAKYESYQGLLQSAEGKYQYFTDDFDNHEHQVKINPTLRLDIADVDAKLGVFVDHLTTEFDTNNYKYTVFGAEPSVMLQDDDYSLELGLGIGAINGGLNDDTEGQFVVYPKVNLHVDLVEDIVMFYAGAQGGVQQNSYASLAQANPFVAPMLDIKPTYTQYDAYVGMKGKLYHNVAYNIRGSYKTEDDKQLFMHNIENDIDFSNKASYQLNNSFVTTYDIVSTLSLYGELNLEFFDNVSINLSGEYNSYDAKNLDKAYNLPETKLGADIHIDFTPKWFAGIQGYMIGKRYDRALTANIDGSNLAVQNVELESFVDMNAYLGYRPTDKWTIFAKANNVFNSEYNYWHNYPVQGVQLSAGAMYKFNF